jgi:hypothetical protein
VDMAKELAEYAKLAVLAQASTAMLSQANKQPLGQRDVPYFDNILYTNKRVSRPAPPGITSLLSNPLVQGIV